MSAPWARAFRLASRLRGERAIHARGLALTGSASFPGGVGLGLPLLDQPGRFEVVARFSRAVGLPSLLPDFLGLALRVVDAGGPGRHQDLLMDTGAPQPLLRQLPLPARDVLGATLSTLLCHRVGHQHLLLGARAATGRRALSLPSLGDSLPVTLELLVATRTGPWRVVGGVLLDAPLPPPLGRRVRFSPSSSGGGIVPVGRLNHWRTGAYEASHVGPDR